MGETDIFADVTLHEEKLHPTIRLHCHPEMSLDEILARLYYGKTFVDLVQSARERIASERTTFFETSASGIVVP